MADELVMDAKMRWFIIGNIIGLILLFFAIAAKEGPGHGNRFNSSPASQNP